MNNKGKQIDRKRMKDIIDRQIDRIIDCQIRNRLIQVTICTDRQENKCISKQINSAIR